MPEKKPWAVFVYLVADDQIGSPANSLDATAEDELDLMFDAVDSNIMHLAVQVDFRHKQRVWRHLERRPEASLPESSAADPRTLERFFEWCYETCPAERHVVLFWGHAFGTAGLFPDSRPQAAAARDLLSVRELGVILAHVNEVYGGRAIDTLLFKNCCLSNLETAYELRDRADLMIASQARLPARGWPYAGLFSELRAQPSNEHVGRGLVRQLSRFYADTQPTRDVPITLLRLDAAGQLRTPMRQLVEQLQDLRDKKQDRWEITGQTALRRAAVVGDPALPDIANLCRHLRDPRGPYSRLLSEAAQAVEHIVTHRLVESHYSKTSGFNGAGIFYRSADAIARSQSIVADVTDVAEYRALAFCRDTNWSTIAIERQRGVAARAYDKDESAAHMEVSHAGRKR